MKNRSWLALLSGLLILCIGASILLLGESQSAAQVEVWSDGVLLRTLPLQIDTVITVQTAAGQNEITVRGGKVAVTGADCPDGYCMQRGFCDSGSPIVCLPHRLVLQFVGNQAIDIVAG